MNETGEDTLDTTTAGKRRRIAGFVMPWMLSRKTLTLGAALSETLTTFTSAVCLRFSSSEVVTTTARHRALGDRAASRERIRESLMSRLTTHNTRQSNNRSYLDIDILIMR